MKALFWLWLHIIGYACAAQVCVLGINDMHANTDDLPRLATFLQAERAADPDLLLLSAGDNRTGNPYVDNVEPPGVPMIRLMNMLCFDASTLGNHEFDAGIRGLQCMMDAANFPFVCANVYAPVNAALNLKPYHIFERNGVRIGVLGLVQVGVNGIPDVHPDHVQGISFRNPKEVVRDYAYLRETCDVLILLTHMGFEDDLELAKLFPEADAIIGGHTHTRVEKEVRENGVLVTQAENKVKYITRLRFEVEGGKVLAKKAELVALHNLPPDAAMAAEAKKIQDAPHFRRQLTIMAQAVTSRESMGCLLADAMRAYAKTDVAIVNRGNVRLESFPAGPFTVADCYRLDPFCNPIIVLKATGRELIAFLNAIPATDHHGAPCVSGMCYKAVKQAGGLQPMCITEATLTDGTPITPDAVYTVATNSYLMSTVTSLPADCGRRAENMDSARAVLLYLEGKATVDYAGVTRAELSAP